MIFKVVFNKAYIFLLIIHIYNLLFKSVFFPKTSVHLNLLL